MPATSLQVKYEMLRAHFVEGEAVTAVCAAYGYSRQTFYLLRDRFARRGVAGLRDGRPGPLGPVKCTPDVVAFLQAQRAADPTVSIVALADRLARDHGVRLHRRTVERLVGRHPRKKALGVPDAPAAFVDATNFATRGGAAQAAYEERRAAMTLQLYHVAGNPHAGTLLMAYLPRERVLVEADAYSPGGAYQPYAANLAENIQKRKLRVDRIVPLHGAIAAYADFLKAVAAQSPPSRGAAR